MARTIIDSIGVVVELDDDPLLEGLRVADRAVETFTSRNRAPLSVRVVPDLTPLEQAIQNFPTLQPLRVPVTLDTAVLDQSLRTLQSRLQGVAEVRATTSLDPGPLQSALADMERLVGTFRTRAEAELELVPTVDTRGTRAGLEQLVQVATAATARLQELRTSLPAPDTSATQTALEGVLASLTKVREGVASLNGARVRVDAGDLLTQLARAQTEIQRLAQTGGVDIPVTLDTATLAAALRGIQGQLQLGAVTVPVALDAAAALASLTQLRTRLNELAAPVTLRVRLEGAEQAQAAARGVTAAISPEAFEAFSQATTQSFGQIAQALNGLQATLAGISGGVEGFFLGAAEALGELSRSSTTAAQAQSDLAQRSLQAAESYRAAGVAEADLNAALERAGFLGVEAARGLDQQTAATLRLAEARRQAALSAGAGPGAAAAVTIPTGFDKLAADQQRVAAGSKGLAEGFALAARQAQILKDAEAALATGSGRMAAGFAVAAEQARVLAAAEDGVTRSSGRAGAATAAHGLGAKQTALHFVTFAAATAGLDTAVARTAANLALAGAGFAGIGTIITGISLAVIAGAEAWHIFNRSQEEAKDKADANREALQRLREAQKGPVVTAQGSFDTQRLEVEKLSKALADLTVRQKEAATIPAGRSGIPSLAAQNDLAKERIGLLKQLADASSLLAAASTAVTDAERQEHGAELLRSLNQEVEAFGLGEIAARKLAVTLDDKLTDAQKKAATGALDHLGALQAQRRAMEESLQATQRLAEAELKRLSAQSQAPLGQTFSLDIDTGGDGLRLLQTEIQDSVALLDRMRKGLDQTSDAAKVLASQANSFRALGERVGEAVKAADAAPLRLLAQAASDLSARLGLLWSGFGDAGTAQSEATQTAQRLGQAYAQLLLEIERQGGPLRASTESLRAASEAAEALSRADVRGAALGTLSEQLEEAQGRLQAFRTLADQLAQDFPEIRVKLELDVQQAEQALAGFFAKLQQRQNETVSVKLNLDIEGGFEKAAAGAKDLGEELPRQFDLARERAALLNRGILDVAESVSSIEGAASRAAQGVLGLLSLFQQLGAANQALQDAQNTTERSAAQLAKTGATLGLIGAGVSVAAGLLGSLFGGGESEGDRIRRENNQRLAELNATIIRQNQGAAGLQGLGNTAGDLSKLADFSAFSESSGLGRSEAFEKALADAGFTVASFAAQIKQATGIDILDSKGRIVAAAFDQASKAIDAMNEAARHFSEDISTQNRVRETEDRLGIGPRAGLDPEQQRLERARAAELEGLNLDPATEKRIAALDLSTEEGRKAFLEFNKSLLILAENGGLTAEQLGKFKNVDELLGPINDAADALEAFKKVTEAASLAQIQSREALRSRLFGDSGQKFDASAEFQSQVAGVGALSPDLAKQFAGLGTIGPEDQAAIRALLQKGFTDLIKGAIPKGLTAEEFQQFLEQGASFLDSFNQEVADATKRLSDLNIPQGFRRAALAFQTGDRGPDNGLQPPLTTRTDEGNQAGVPLPRPIQLDSKPVPVTLDIRQIPLAGDGASLPALADVLSDQRDVLEDLLAFLSGGDATGPATHPVSTAPPVSITIAPGAIVIHVQPGQDPRDTAQSVLSEFRRLAMAQTGDTLQTGSFS